MSNVNRIIVTANCNDLSPTGFGAGDAPTILRKFSSLFGGLAQGAWASKLQMAFNPVAAQATVTCSGNGTNGDTLTVAGVAITIVTSGAAASSNQVNLGSAGNGTDLATRIAALINGTALTAGFSGTSTSWSGICTASVAGAVITLTAAIPGTIGNGLALAKSSTAITLTNAWGTSVAGTEGTAATFHSGI